MSLRQELLQIGIVRVPQFRGVSFSAHFEPTASIGGDYYDVTRVNSKCWSAVVADVSGKGVGSALLASLLQGALITATASAPSSVLLVESNVMMRLIKREPAAVVHLVNYLLQRTRKVEEDLIDHLFNSSETSLARKLLSLADCGEKEKAFSTRKL